MDPAARCLTNGVAQCFCLLDDEPPNCRGGNAHKAVALGSAKSFSMARGFWSMGQRCAAGFVTSLGDANGGAPFERRPVAATGRGSRNDPVNHMSQCSPTVAAHR